jgi:regulatory protein
MPRRSAVDYALYLLGRRSRTERELRRKLVDKGYAVEEIDQVLQRLEAIKLIDDKQFARNYAQDKVRIYRRGSHRISLELLQKGVDREIIADVVKDIPLDDELSAARSLLVSRQHSWAKLTDRQRFERSVALLQRRGFRGAVIRQALADK